jgi:hypothetical protein
MLRASVRSIRSVTYKFGWPLLSLILISCSQPKTSYHSVEWEGIGDLPNWEGLEFKEQPSAFIGGQAVRWEPQTVDGVLVEGAYRKVILDGNQPVWLKANLLKGTSNLKKPSDKKIQNAWKKFLDKNQEYLQSEVFQKPDPVFSPDLNIQAILGAKDGQLYKVSFDLHGKLIQKSRVGSEFENSKEILAWLFPLGPQKSNLQEVILKTLSADGPLATPNILLDSQSPNKVTSNMIFHFSTEDERFDQAQAFYYVSKIFSWFEEQFSLKFPMKVKILSGVGYPEKTNTAFYFQNQIRLGSGDDQIWSKIPQDPTIVMHEASHALIDMLSRLPFEKEGGSINEGFADTLTTYFLKSPLLGDSAYKKGPFKRNVEKVVKLSEKNGGLYHDSAIVSSFFWSLRNLVGEEKAMPIVMRTLIYMTPDSDFKQFIKVLKAGIQEKLNAEDQGKALALMSERELI